MGRKLGLEYPRDDPINPIWRKQAPKSSYMPDKDKREISKI